VPILAYHKVDNRIELGINSVSVDAFKKQVNYLVDQNYYSISLYEYLFQIDHVDNKRRPIVITFDDSDESVFTNAFPILSEAGFKATIFVISDFVGRLNTWDSNLGQKKSRHMTWEQLQALSREGWEVSSHTATHRDLTRLNREEMLHEVQYSKQVIAETISNPVHFISYPFNRYNAQVVDVVQRVGYLGGCVLTTCSKRKGLNSNFTLRRFGVYSIDSIRSLKQKLKDSSFENIKQEIISFCSRGTIWYNQLRNYKKILHLF